MDNVPKVFEFKGGIIILANRLNETDEHLQALITRCNFYELNFSYKEKLKIMSEIAKKPYKNTNSIDRGKALKILVDNTDITTEHLNFRTLIKTFDFLIYDSKNAEKLLKATIKVDEGLKLVKNLMESNKGINEQIAEYVLKTGKSRATFYRIKDRIKELMK